MLSEDKKSVIEENYRKISDLMRENENILREAGYNPPVTDFSIERNARINIPSGYIRVNEAFSNKYQLNTLCASVAVRKNIAYSLQLSDFFSFILNRFFIWGSIESVLLKLAIINIASIIEALILEVANRICDHPNSCGRVSTCQNHMNKKERDFIQDAFCKLQEFKVIELDGQDIALFIQIIGLRNNVHIRLADENEFTRGDYSLNMYNKSIKLLQKIAEQLFAKSPQKFCLQD